MVKYRNEVKGETSVSDEQTTDKGIAETPVSYDQKRDKGFAETPVSDDQKTRVLQKLLFHKTKRGT